MAGERRRVAGELAAWHVAMVATMLGAKNVNVQELNPYRERAEPTEAARRLDRWKKRRQFRSWVDSLRPKR